MFQTQSQSKPTSIQDLRDWMVSRLSETVKLPREKIDVRKSFQKYGVDSVDAVMILADLEAWLGCMLPETLAMEFPDIESLSAHLAERLGLARRG